jgi:hypothetical protein
MTAISILKIIHYSPDYYEMVCFLAEVPYGGELYISIDYGFKDFLESNGGGALHAPQLCCTGAQPLV